MSECDLPPSAKAIRVTLKLAGPCTWSEIKDHTQLPDSTLADGLDALEAADAIETKTSHGGPDQYVRVATPNTGANG